MEGIPTTILLMRANSRSYRRCSSAISRCVRYSCQYIQLDLDRLGGPHRLSLFVAYGHAGRELVVVSLLGEE